MSIELELAKRRSMSLNGLANTSVATIQLHGPFDFECGRVCGVSGDADEHHPLLVTRDSVVYNLRSRKGCMAVENLLRRRCLVSNCPVVHRGIRDHSNRRVVDPFPEYDIFIIDVRLDFLLCLNIEYL